MGSSAGAVQVVLYVWLFVLAQQLVLRVEGWRIFLVIALSTALMLRIAELVVDRVLLF
ncbi:hypothetical protein [Sodalis sp.]|uniref:hypothetical protein n=1 Tax=Sodalis sp. (in: enterobacteria) TaxID=1898979 RepID=UPI0038738343